ncbi:MAG: hypothetical protein ACR2HQ_11435 [Ilumatobacteraceae bacterium]
MTVDAAVRLEVPPELRYLAAARTVAAALAVDAGMTVDDLEDLRLGVGELTTVLMDGVVGEANGVRVVLKFALGDRSVTVSGAVEGASITVAPDPLTAKILSAVADHYELGPSSFVFTKSSSFRERG